MADRLRWIGRRLDDLGTGFVYAFVRDNRILPPVLAVLALFVIAWILAGAFMGGTDQKPVAHKADLAQSDLAKSDNARSGGNPVFPGVENRDVKSYAAYRSKDPFRELLAPEKTTPEQPTTTPPEQTTPETTTGTGGTPGRPGAGAANRDTDGDGVPDTGRAGAGSGTSSGTGTGATPGTGPTGRGGARAPGGRKGDLLNSGGILSLP